MNGRTCRRWGFLALAVGATTGCTGIPGVAPAVPPLTPWPGKSHPAANDNPRAGVRPADPPAPTGVVQAGGQAPASPPATLPPPQSFPPPTDPGAGLVSKFPAPTHLPSADPHARATPTVTGGRWNLGPGEVPADRVADLSRQLELVLGQNKELVGRIRELEAHGMGREQALAEAMREVEAASAEVARTRATLNTLRGELSAVQKQLQEMEAEDVRIFEGVLRALDRLLPPLPPPRREP